MGIKEVFESFEVVFGEDGFDRNGNPKKEKIRKPFAKPGDGKKLLDDIVKEVVKNIQKTQR
jgi:hypothetical protein